MQVSRRSISPAGPVSVHLSVAPESWPSVQHSAVIVEFSGDSYTHGVGTQLLNKSRTLWARGTGKPGGRAGRRPGCIVKTPCPSPSHTPTQRR